MSRKVTLAAAVALVLLMFGIAGLQKTHDTEAGALAGSSGWNPTAILVGGSSSITFSFYDDNGTSALGLQIANGIFTASSVPGCAATVQGIGTNLIRLFDAGTGTTANPGPGCDTDANATLYQWTVTATCTTAGTMSLTANPADPATGLPLANPAGGFGSLLPGYLNLPASSLVLTCLETGLPGINGSTISVRKLDQFGQPRNASFSIQQGPFWIEVARITVEGSLGQNPCTTAGGGGSGCSSPGVVTPAPFLNGLPAGTYRVIEVASFDAHCRLVQVYNGNLSASQSLTQPNAGALLTQPVTVTVPSANPLDLDLTFVNSCTLAGAPSTATSKIAVVIGGTTPGIVNRETVEIYPAPGSDDDARVDLYIADANNIPIANAHVTMLIDKGTLAIRRDISAFPNAGYDVISSFQSDQDGDTCDQSTNGWLQQSTTTGAFTWPFLTASRQVQDGYTGGGGGLSACVYVDPTLAPGTTPGTINIQAIVETPAQGGLAPGAGNPYYPLGTNLALPNYLAAANIVLTARLTVIGPPASITVSAAPTSLTCGEKATITVTVKDAAGQNVSDRTRVELVTNYGGVIGGTAATLGPVSVTGGQVYPVSSSSAETFNGTATAFLLTSTNHVGPYEVVAAAGGSVMARNGAIAPWYTPGLGTAGDPTLSTFSYYPWYNQGLLTYQPGNAPVNAQATVTCSVPGAAAGGAPVVTAPRTGQGPADAFAIRPPNTGDGGLALPSSDRSGWTLLVAFVVGIAFGGIAGGAVNRRRPR